MNNPDHISESLETIFGVKILNSFKRIRDGKNSLRHEFSTGSVLYVE